MKSWQRKHSYKMLQKELDRNWNVVPAEVNPDGLVRVLSDQGRWEVIFGRFTKSAKEAKAVLTREVPGLVKDEALKKGFRFILRGEEESLASFDGHQVSIKTDGRVYPANLADWNRLKEKGYWDRGVIRPLCSILGWDENLIRRVLTQYFED